MEYTQSDHCQNCGYTEFWISPIHCKISWYQVFNKQGDLFIFDFYCKHGNLFSVSSREAIEVNTNIIVTMYNIQKYGNLLKNGIGLFVGKKLEGKNVCIHFNKQGNLFINSKQGKPVWMIDHCQNCGFTEFWISPVHCKICWNQTGKPVLNYSFIIL